MKTIKQHAEACEALINEQDIEMLQSECHVDIKSRAEVIEKTIIDAISERCVPQEPTMLIETHEKMERQLRGIMSRKDSEILELDKTVAALRTAWNKLDPALQKAIGWFDRGIPRKPDHICGNPDSNCDMLCTDWANFCDDLVNFRNLVGKDGG